MSTRRCWRKVVAAPEHREGARLAAQRSMVLLRNEGGLLPLAKDLKNVAVIGPLADSMEATEGSWMVFGHTPAAVTVLQGIRAKLPDAKVEYAPGPEIRRDIPSLFDELMPGAGKKARRRPSEAEAAFQTAVATARGADLVVMVLGETDDMAGRGRLARLARSAGRQEELLKAVVALGKPVVLVLLNGRPLSINWAAENVPGHPRSLGTGHRRRHAVADILFGDVEPGRQAAGHLPAQGQPCAALLRAQPDPLARRQPDVQPALLGRPATPLYPFGFGLSYTTFAIDNLKVSAPQVKVGEQRDRDAPT